MTCNCSAIAEQGAEVSVFLGCLQQDDASELTGMYSRVLKNQWPAPRLPQNYAEQLQLLFDQHGSLDRNAFLAPFKSELFGRRRLDIDGIDVAVQIVGNVSAHR